MGKLTNVSHQILSKMHQTFLSSIKTKTETLQYRTNSKRCHNARVLWYWSVLTWRYRTTFNNRNRSKYGKMYNTEFRKTNMQIKPCQIINQSSQTKSWRVPGNIEYYAGSKSSAAVPKVDNKTCWPKKIFVAGSSS